MKTVLQYFPRLVLLFWGIFCLVAALIHLFVFDGGSHSIAGLETSPTLIGIFAWAGATQLVWSIMMILTALKYQDKMQIMLILVLIERLIITINAWFFKPPSETHHQPPEVYITLWVLPMLLIALILIIKNKKSSI